MQMFNTCCVNEEYSHRLSEWIRGNSIRIKKLEKFPQGVSPSKHLKSMGIHTKKSALFRNLIPYFPSPERCNESRNTQVVRDQELFDTNRLYNDVLGLSRGIVKVNGNESLCIFQGQDVRIMRHDLANKFHINVIRLSANHINTIIALRKYTTSVSNLSNYVGLLGGQGDRVLLCVWCNWPTVFVEWLESFSEQQVFEIARIHRCKDCSVSGAYGKNPISTLCYVDEKKFKDYCNVIYAEPYEQCCICKGKIPSLESYPRTLTPAVRRKARKNTKDDYMCLVCNTDALYGYYDSRDEEFSDNLKKYILSFRTRLVRVVEVRSPQCSSPLIKMVDHDYQNMIEGIINMLARYPLIIRRDGNEVLLSNGDLKINISPDIVTVSIQGQMAICRHQYDLFRSLEVAQVRFCDSHSFVNYLFSRRLRRDKDLMLKMFATSYYTGSVPFLRSGSLFRSAYVLMLMLNFVDPKDDVSSALKMMSRICPSQRENEEFCEFLSRGSHSINDRLEQIRTSFFGDLVMKFDV